jgi:hypothetical protein
LFINKVDPFTFTVGAVRKIRTGRVRQRRKAKGTKPVPSPQLAYQLITIFLNKNEKCKIAFKIKVTSNKSEMCVKMSGSVRV